MKAARWHAAKNILGRESSKYPNEGQVNAEIVEGFEALAKDPSEVKVLVDINR